MDTSEQLRAARALLEWTRDDLAKAAGISAETIKRLEKGKQGALSANMNTVRALREALEAAGIQFIPENGGKPGVRPK